MSSVKTRAKAAMKVTAIRFGQDLWRLLEGEAARVGVSVSQYVREAALARAAAAAKARGEDPLDLLARAGEDKPSFRSARDVRGQAQETRSEAQAVRAESRQAAHRARQLSSERRSPQPPM